MKSYLYEIIPLPSMSAAPGVLIPDPDYYLIRRAHAHRLHLRYLSPLSEAPHLVAKATRHGSRGAAAGEVAAYGRMKRVYGCTAVCGTSL